MKCAYCSRPATIHITEIINGTAKEVHLCEEHARRYIAGETEGFEEASQPQGSGSIKPKEHLQMLAAKPSEGELARLDKRSCPACGITFREFRRSGRLGCANDYEVFKEELVPLLENIHGAAQHCGKAPQRAPQTVLRTSELLKLRKQLRDAVEREDYEKAAELRDRIRELEQQGG